MKYIIFIVFILIASIVISQSYSSIGTNKKQEIASEEEVSTISFKVLAAQDGYQIRQYPELTVASTDLNTNTYSNNSSTGFRKIASYIFGGNSSKEGIDIKPFSLSIL